jgi:cation-transporting ATPase E
VRDNVFTYFNLIFFVLALCIIAVRSYQDLTFLPIIIINIVIGIVQELRSRAALSKLKFVSSPRARVIRGGQRLSVPSEKTVLDDVAVFGAGEQIYADALVLDGECRVNESLVTGEADEIVKTAGDTLLSGSFVISGECRARLNKVGAESFASRLAIEAKKTKGKAGSQMMTALNRLVSAIGVIIIPVGLAMFFVQTRVLGSTAAEGAVATVAALIGMIPEGLFLLVSVALTVSILRLAKKRTLVHEMKCIETLARVDVLCVDKTGTITEPEMLVREIVPLCPERFSAEDIQKILTDLTGNMSQDNETMAALKRCFPRSTGRRATGLLPFSSRFKFCGAQFSEWEAYLLGAPEKILARSFGRYRNQIEPYSAQGFRVLLLALYDGDIAAAGASGVTEEALPLALVLITNKIRPAAPPAFRFFAEQGVTIKVISGDNPLAVSQIARDAGIANTERYIDASTLTTERNIRSAARDYTVFGRVTPDQKRKLIRALKALGHTVAMTGDGVNDVLALKDADCSIAMASGSDVACQVSQLVLLDSNFGALPAIVMEGRRVINNLERSSALFLVKNIFSLLLAVLTLIFTLVYPLTPSQLTLFNMMFIGIPSFVFALEPNTRRVRGKFLPNVLSNAFPGGLTALASVLAALFLCERLSIPTGEMQTMSTILLSFVGLLMLLKFARPFNSLRAALVVSMAALFILGSFILRDLFSMSPLSLRSAGITAALAAASLPLLWLLTLIMSRFRKTGGRRQ